MKQDLQEVRAELLLYLAGKLSPEARDDFDRRLLEDESYALAIDEVEEDLMEDYAAGALQAAELPVVTHWVAASPERQRRVALIAALRSPALRSPVALTEAKTPRRGLPAARPAMWAWMLPVAASLALLALLPSLHRERLAGTQTRTPAGTQGTAAPTPQARVEAGPERTDTILLDTRRFRGNGERPPGERLHELHAGAKTRIQILLPPGASPGAEGVYTLDFHPMPTAGQPSIHIGGLKPTGSGPGAYVELILPPGSMRAGAYAGDLRSGAANYPLRFSVGVEAAAQRR